VSSTGIWGLLATLRADLGADTFPPASEAVRRTGPSRRSRSVSEVSHSSAKTCANAPLPSNWQRIAPTCRRLRGCGCGCCCGEGGGEARGSGSGGAAPLLLLSRRGCRLHAATSLSFIPEYLPMRSIHSRISSADGAEITNFPPLLLPPPRSSPARSIRNECG
jgi:hypothetical protein